MKPHLQILTSICAFLEITQINYPAKRPERVPIDCNKLGKYLKLIFYILTKKMCKNYVFH